KIVGECYPFNENSAFVLTFDNHNSVNGLREFCKNKNGHFTYAPMFYDTLQIDETKLNTILQTEKKLNNLFAFPAQSNVSGIKHDLSWIKKAKEKGWDVLLDAAAFVPTSPLDLKQHPADFVSVSFYKIFGFPTGIGCLLVKKDIYPKLKKPWFAGGTVSFAAVQDPIFKLQNDHERFEDGTVNYLHIPAIKNGLDYIKSIGINKINNRVKNITAYLLDTLQNLKHSNGKPLIQIYGPKNTDVRGGTIIFNILNSKGEEMPYTAIEEQANAKNISIRTGCFCNPGIDEITHCISTTDLAKYYSAKDGATFQEMVTYLGKMRGAVRISVGFITNKNDLETLINFLKTYKDN
ncbi:MAG: aminotransferase class V-fold PLP-dependent enzyme, partial [Bacteroidetes bacterium]|nr:aminotransferase class V-fold PLP-dependent enzyme [Bacteroidota bacterium]